VARVGRPVRERRARRQLRVPLGRHRLRRPQQEEHAAGLGAAGHDRLRRGPRRRRGDERAARALPQAARGQAGPRPGRRDHRGSASTGSSAGGATHRSSSRPTPPASWVAASSSSRPTPRPRRPRATRSAGCSRSAAARPGSSSPTSSTATRRSPSSTSAARPGRRRHSRPATSPSWPSRSPTRSSSSATASRSSRASSTPAPARPLRTTPGCRRS
jgi:hypothetical protein